MNDFSELEAELKQLRPAAPSRELAKRIERALEEAPATETRTAGILPKPKLRVNWFTLGLGVAAAAALLLLARLGVDHAPADAPQIAANTPAMGEAQPAPNPDTVQRGYVAEGITRVVYTRLDEGLAFPDDSEQPVRRVRSQTHETTQWRDPSTGASLRVSYPAEEVEFIPVAGQ
jgi:hypothetical protein